MRPVRATFFVFGTFWGTWAVVAFDVQRFLGFSDAQLGLLLAGTVVGGVIANAAGGVLAERHGTAFMLSTALVVWGGLLAFAASATAPSLFCVAFLMCVAAGGLVDVVMNVAGTAALGAQPARLLRLHALFNAGAVTGAAASGVLLDHGASFRTLWWAEAAVAGFMAVWCRRADLPASEKGEHHTVREGVAALRRAGLVFVAVVFALGALVEGGIDTWGVLFLRSNLGLAALAGAAAYVVGQSLATGARSTLGWTTDHIGQRRGAQWGLRLAGAGLLLEALSSNPLPAAIGLGAAAVGAAVYWPLLLSYANEDSDRPGVIVGGLSACGYLGFLAGPPVVGWVAQATSLRWGIGVLAAAALAGATIPIRRRSAASASASAAHPGSSTAI